jgi:hypothetical protein
MVALHGPGLRYVIHGEKCGMKRDTSGRSGKAMRSLLITLAILLVSLVASPVQARPAADDQYDRLTGANEHHERRTGVEHDAATAAVIASEALNDAEANSSDESTPSTAEEMPAPAESTTAAAGEIAEAATAVPEADIALKSLPDTGGISPLLLGVLLVAAGGLIRYVAR